MESKQKWITGFLGVLALVSILLIWTNSSTSTTKEKTAIAQPETESTQKQVEGKSTEPKRREEKATQKQTVNPEKASDTSANLKKEEVTSKNAQLRNANLGEEQQYYEESYWYAFLYNKMLLEVKLFVFFWNVVVISSIVVTATVFGISVFYYYALYPEVTISFGWIKPVIKLTTTVAAAVTYIIPRCILLIPSMSHMYVGICSVTIFPSYLLLSLFNAASPTFEMLNKEYGFHMLFVSFSVLVFLAYNLYPWQVGSKKRQKDSFIKRVGTVVKRVLTTCTLASLIAAAVTGLCLCVATFFSAEEVNRIECGQTLTLKDRTLKKFVVNLWNELWKKFCTEPRNFKALDNVIICFLGGDLMSLNMKEFVYALFNHQPLWKFIWYIIFIAVVPYAAVISYFSLESVVLLSVFIRELAINLTIGLLKNRK